MALIRDLHDKYERIPFAALADNKEILDFFATISMDTEALHLRYVREPDFFSFLEQQGGPAVAILFRNDDGSLGGVATITTRHCVVNGCRVLVGYNGDLRVSPQISRRTRVQWRRIYAEIVEHYREYEDIGCPEYLYTVIIDGNLGANRAFLKANANPAYREIVEFNSINIFGQVCRPLCNYVNRRRLKASGYDFSWATSADLADLKQFLYQENKDKQLGTAYTAQGDGELERRFSSWEDFGLASFLLVRKEGVLVACLAPWSNGDARRIVIEKAPWPLRLLGATLPLFGEKAIEVGSELKTLYLTSMEIDSSLSRGKRAELLGFMVDYLFLGDQFQQYNLVSIFNSANCSFSESVHGKGYLYTTQKAALYQVLSGEEMQAERFISVADNEIVGFELATA